MELEKKGVIDVRYEALRRLVLSKLKDIQKEKFDHVNIKRVTLLFKIFLLKYLNLNYKFTKAEFSNKLARANIPRKLKEKIIEILNWAIEVEYSNREISKDEFRKLISDLMQVVDSAIEQAEEGLKQELDRKELKKRLLEELRKKKEKLAEERRNLLERLNQENKEKLSEKVKFDNFDFSRSLSQEKTKAKSRLRDKSNARK